MRSVFSLLFAVGVWTSALQAAGAEPGAVGDGAAPLAAVAPAGSSFELEELEHAVGVELARLDLQLAILGVALSYERRATGYWVVTASKQDLPRCTRQIELGAIDALSAAEVMRVGAAIAAVLRDQQGCGSQPPRSLPARRARPTPSQSKRAALLREALHDVTRTSTVLAVMSGVEGAFGAAWLIGMAVDDSAPARLGFETPADAIGTLGGSIALGGGVAAILAPEDHRWTLYGASYLLVPAALELTLALGSGSKVAEESALIFAEGSVLTSGLLVLSGALRPPPIARLRREAERLSADSSEADVRRIEALLRRTEPALPGWLVFAPFIVGGVGAGLYSLKAKPEDKDAKAIGLTSSLYSILLLGALAPSSAWVRYERALHGVGLRSLSLTPGPGDLGGLGLAGTF